MSLGNARMVAMNALQLRARKWLIDNDPTPERFWESAPLNSDFINDVRQNLRSFGPDQEGGRILADWRQVMGVRA